MNVRQLAVASMVTALHALPAAAHEAPTHVHLADGSVLYMAAAMTGVAVLLAASWLVLRRRSAQRRVDPTAKETASRSDLR